MDLQGNSPQDSQNIPDVQFLEDLTKSEPPDLAGGDVAQY